MIADVLLALSSPRRKRTRIASGDADWRQRLETALREAACRSGLSPAEPLLRLIAEMVRVGILDQDEARLIGAIWSAGDPDGHRVADPKHFRWAAEQLITRLQFI